MKMKSLAKAFTIVGLVLNTHALIILLASIGKISLFTIILCLLLLAISFVFDFLVLKSLKENDFNENLGILSIFFVNIPTGIFYLLWNPKPEDDIIDKISEVLDNIEEHESIINWDKYDTLSNKEKRNYLRELWFDNKISQERYQQMLDQIKD